MTGKARGGGVHHGLRRSLNTGSFVLEERMIVVYMVESIDGDRIVGTIG